MTHTQSYAKNELQVLALTVPDAIVTPFTDEILALCEKFGKSGQSGGSAPFTATAISQAVKKLLLQEPICPITGIDEEWVHIREASESDDMEYQNKRCGGLFKGKSGKCWYLDAIVKKTQNGACWSGGFWMSKEDYLTGDRTRMIGCSHYVKSFPFTPKTFYIDVIEEEVSKDNWEMFIKNPEQLKKVFKFYDQKK